MNCPKDIIEEASLRSYEEYGHQNSTIKSPVYHLDISEVSE
jgi:hypothetical protein